MNLYLATTNRHKEKEILAFFQSYDSFNTIKILTIGDIASQNPDLRDFEFKVEETGENFMENAALKAKAMLEIMPTQKIIAEDSGLVIEKTRWKTGYILLPICPKRRRKNSKSAK